MMKPKNPKFMDIEGLRFGMLFVDSYAGKRSGKHYWVVTCDCGLTKEIRGGTLTGGLAFSCGCIGAQNRLNALTTHGMKGTPEYNTWRAMKSRCSNPSRPEYKNYGGRGIKVCDRWKDSFENFIEDMGLKPSKLHSIERVDNNNGYFKGNCKWATAVEQAANRRTKKEAEEDDKKNTSQDR